jgi:pyruvate carboxylase subunit B
MSKKIIEVMDTSLRDGFQSVFGARVLMEDFMPSIESAINAGILHFEAGGGARFQSLYLYLNEDAFTMMDEFRRRVGPDVNLQTLARGSNYVGLEIGSRDVIDLHARLFKKHGISTIRNFDALNDIRNLEFSGNCIHKAGMKHEVTVTLMDLPPGCEGAHDVDFYEKILRNILDSGVPFDSVCFKDASGTSNPRKVFNTICMARQLLPAGTHLRLHTHETAGVSVACYIAAIEAGADGIDLAREPVSGGTSQPDILTMMHALKGTEYVLGNHMNEAFDAEKILESEMVLQECLKDYFMPPEATKVSVLIPFSPMPGGALTSNTQMMRDNNCLDKFPEIIKAMREVVEKGGFGTSVTPVSQFYFQQAFNNVLFGKWTKIAENYGKMVLGYFGKTPCPPDPEIVRICREQLKLEPTQENPLNIADRDEKKSLDFARKMLAEKGLPDTEENIFIVAACKEKGIDFLCGNAQANVRKNSNSTEKKAEKSAEKATTASTSCTARPQNNDCSNYTVMVNGKKYAVQVKEGSDEEFAITPIQPETNPQAPRTSSATTRIEAGLPASVFKILVQKNDTVKKGQPVIILESMKMEVEIQSPVDGIISSIEVSPGQKVQSGQNLITVGGSE